MTSIATAAEEPPLLDPCAAAVDDPAEPLWDWEAVGVELDPADEDVPPVDGVVLPVLGLLLPPDAAPVGLLVAVLLPLLCVAPPDPAELPDDPSAGCGVTVTVNVACPLEKVYGVPFESSRITLALHLTVVVPIGYVSPL